MYSKMSNALLRVKTHIELGLTHYDAALYYSESNEIMNLIFIIAMHKET